MTRLADVTTDTPHGPRPVPEGHVETDNIPMSRRLPGPKKDGPNWLILGGMGVAAAATTALGVLAVRTVVDVVAGSDEDEDHRERPRRRRPSRTARRGVPPHIAAMGPGQQRTNDHDSRSSAVREAALRNRPPRPSRKQAGFLDDLGSSASRVAANISNVVNVANAAVEGFQQVSGRADGIVRDFLTAADRVRSFLDTRSTDGHSRRDVEPTRARPSVMTQRRARFVDLRDDDADSSLSNQERDS